MRHLVEKKGENIPKLRTRQVGQTRAKECIIPCYQRFTSRPDSYMDRYSCTANSNFLLPKIVFI